MPKRIALIVVIAAVFSVFPMRLSAQQKYIGLTLCSGELQSYRSRFGVRLDRLQHAYLEYRELPTTRLVMIVVFADNEFKDQCGSIRDAREFKYSQDVFDEECIEALHPENVVVGFFDQKFEPNDTKNVALMRGPAVKSWRIDLKNLKFLPTSGKVTCVLENRLGDDDGSDLAIWAHQRAVKKIKTAE